MDAGVTFLLEKVTEVIHYYSDLVMSADKELKDLEQDLDSLKSCLEESAQKKHKRPRLKQLEKEMRDLVYEVEDTLDICLTDADAAASAAATASKSKRNRFRIGKLAPKSINLAERVKSLRQENVKKMLEKANNLLNSAATAESGSGSEESGTLVTKVIIISLIDPLLLILLLFMHIWDDH